MDKELREKILNVKNKNELEDILDENRYIISHFHLWDKETLNILHKMLGNQIDKQEFIEHFFAQDDSPPDDFEE